MVQDIVRLIGKHDPEVGHAIEQEVVRQKRNLELIASENIVSPAVMAAMGSVLTNKYAEGYPGKRYYNGCEYVDVAEELAKERACKLFGAKFSNVQPHAGAQANYVAFVALCNPGDTVLGMDLCHGGHLTHGSRANFSGKYYNIIPYGVTDDTHVIDYDNVRALAKEHKPKMIIAGASAYPRVIDFKAFSDIAKEVGAYLMVDMAHIAGLVAAGEHPSPIPYADVVTTTTHKTLRGPRGGLILWNDEDLTKKINSALFPGVQAGPLMHVVASKAIAFGEAMQPEFKTYQRQVVKNAAALANALQKHGFKLVSGGTDNHLMIMDLLDFGLTGKELATRLDEVHITVNKNTIPNDPQSPFVTSGVRVGSPAVTTRGFQEADMETVAELLHLATTQFDEKADEVRQRVEELTNRYPIYED